MSTPLLLELFGGFLAACMALWFVALSRPADQPSAAQSPANDQWITTSQAQRMRSVLEAYVLKPGAVASLGLLLLRLAIGVMMIHHGQEKLADPQQFANTYVASLHLPFPLFFAYAAGFSELIGSWLVILGLLTPVGALALTGTMTVAAYQHILTAGLNIYVLELVVLYLGGSLALLLVGPGRFSFDAGMLPGLLVKPAARIKPETSAPSTGISGWAPAYVPIKASNSNR
jgi:putative oxidoreductase